MIRQFANCLSILFVLILAQSVYAQATIITFGGDGTEINAAGVLSGDGPIDEVGLGAALLDTFIVLYRAGGNGRWVNNIFPDPEVYSFEMDIPDSLPDYQSMGVHGDFWKSRGRNDEGILPWTNEEWREGSFFNARYRPTGEELPYGLVESEPQWTVNYWQTEFNASFVHTILAGTVGEFVFNEASGDVFAYLPILNTAYVGYGEDEEPGPGIVEYANAAYQGFDSFREPSGRLNYSAFILEYDAGQQAGRLTSSIGRVILFTPAGEIHASYNSIQAAINRAGPGFTVLVLPGEYNENIDFLGRNTTVTSLYQMTGDERYIAETIIDGRNLGSVVTIEMGETEAARLTGFTIINGLAEYGGGIYIADSSPTIDNCVFLDNTAENSGGGIYINDGDPTIKRCVFQFNSATIGGGGGIFAQQSNFIVDHCLINDNTGRWGGGLGARNSGSPVIKFTEISNNESSHSAGLYLYSIGDVTIQNCTIANNDAIQHSGGIHLALGSEVNITNSILWGNEPEHVKYSNIGERGVINIDFSCIQDGQNGFNLNNNGDLNWGEQNITDNPRFVNEREEDYHLQEDSPCINSGDPEMTYDPDGTVSDMGAYYIKQNPYLTVPDEFASIQLAIDASVDGDTILVSPGRYPENLDFNGKEITVASYYLLREDSAGFDIHSTVIDGSAMGTVVTFENGESAETRLIGFTLTNGAILGNGGGIRVSNSSPTIRDCRIVNCYANVRGGGISIEPEAHPQIIRCYIATDSASSGGAGIWIGDNSNPVITECIVENNRARWNGGGINMYQNSSPTISNCVIIGNLAGSKGGGIMVSEDCSPLITDCKILNNESFDPGGGIAVENAASPNFLRCIITRNYTSVHGAGIACFDTSVVDLVNCTIYENAVDEDEESAIFISASELRLVNTIYSEEPGRQIWFDSDSVSSSTLVVTYSDLTEGEDAITTNDNGEVSWLEGNIALDPLFTNADNDTFDLAMDSPCIDTGTPFFVWEQDTIIDLTRNEYFDDAPDMGAIESNFNRIEDPFSGMPGQFVLYPNYPNPFNSSTIIRFDQPFNADVTLSIFDLTGRKVAQLVEGRLSEGSYTYSWQADGLPSGLYFLRLQGRSQTRMQKIMLLR